MAYNDFTLDTVVQQFGLEVREEADHWAGVTPAPVSAWLAESLAQGSSLAVAVGTEKARSEFLIAPVLAEVRRHLGGRVSLFSGVAFDVDPERGLRGACDFLFSLSPVQSAVQAPVVAVAEAKNENIRSGLGQCVAEMLAAQTFNERRGRPLPAVFGVVTTGTNWKFLRLEGTALVLDLTEYYITRPDRIVGILTTMMGLPTPPSFPDTQL